uniref:Uncharacterized protein NT03AP0009 n=1 Tax=Alvinella pompejana epibiont 7G3 TaxID=244800 RepID=Q6W3L9_9BACT|nr:hypothetical protein [Alvinella pompejana epibiont 7G3]
MRTKMTNKQIANFIAGKYFEREEYKKFKIENNLKIDRDASKIISILKKKFNLSQQVMDSYLEEIERTKPMPKTQLLVFMIDELAKYGLEWKTREELFITLFPKKDYKNYEKSWNQWLTQHTEDIRNRSILVSLEERLNFDSSLWKTPEDKQRVIDDIKENIQDWSFVYYLRKRIPLKKLKRV